MKRTFPMLIALALAALAARAHDFWIWPKTFRPAPGSRVTLAAGVGEDFPKFTNPVTLDRIEGLRLFAPGGAAAQPLTALEFGIGAPGAYMLALAVQQRFIELKPDDFRRYVTGEEFAHVLRARKESGQEDRPGREIYSRYSKLLVQAGAGDDRALTRLVGHELEIVPEKNPARLALLAGGDFPVRVLFRGKPLAGARVSAAPEGGLAGKGGHDFPVVARTGANGRAVLRLTRPGPWYARMIHMIPHSGADADWRSFFATLTFSAGKP